jgi:hypothetical protein
MTEDEKENVTQTQSAIKDTSSYTEELLANSKKQIENFADIGYTIQKGDSLTQNQLNRLNSTAENSYRVQKQQVDYNQQRKNLELQFLSQVESDIRASINKVVGPAGMGVSGQNATLNAYATYGSFLEKPFSNALTKVFGTSGGAYGQIFSKLAGSYINQAMASAILPAMGIDANMFNRALSNYTAGKQVRDQYKVAQTEYNITKAEYDAAAAKVTLADRLNAAKPGKVNEIKKEQIAKVDALEAALQQKGATLDTIGKAKSANKSMYTEDLIMAMTGMPTGIRSMMGYESGQDQLTKQLTMMIGGDVAQSAFGGAGLQDYMNEYRQMYGQQLQGQASVSQQAAALQGQVGVNNAEMQFAVSQQHAQMMNQVLVAHTNRMGQMGFAGQQQGGGFFEMLGNVGSTISNVGKFFGIGGGSTGTFSPNVNEFGIETFDDGSNIQYFDDGSTLVMDTAGGFSSTDAFVPPTFTQTLTNSLTNFGNTLTSGVRSIFSPSTSTGGGTMMGGTMMGGNMMGGNRGNMMSSNDIFGSILGSAVSNKLGISGPSAGIVGSAMRDLLGGQGFGRTSSYIQGPGSFASSLFNIYGLKNANTSSLGGTLNTALNAYQLYQGIASGSMVASTGGLIQSLGSSLGSQTIANFGSGMASGQSAAQLSSAYQAGGMSTPSGMSAGANIGAAGTVAAGLIGGHYLGRAVSAGYSTGGSGNSTVNVGTALGAAAGGTKLGMMLGSPGGPIGMAIGALIGGLLGGAVNRLFGRKPKAVTGTGVQVTMGGEQGASGQAYSDWVQKGGKYRSDKSGRDFSAIDPELLKYFGDTTVELQKAYGAMGKTMGLSADSLKGFQRYYDISFAGMNQQQSADKIQETMKTYTRDMLISQYGDITRFSKDLGDGKREDVLDTFQRLSKSSELVDYYMRAFGNSSEQTAKLLQSSMDVNSIMGKSLLTLPETTPGGILSRWKKRASDSVGEVATAAGNISKDIIKAIGDEATDPNFIKLQIAGLKDALIESFGGSEAFSKEMGEAFSALYTQEEQAAFARDTAISNTQGLLEAVSVSPEIKAYLDKFATGGITKAEDV